MCVLAAQITAIGSAWAHARESESKPTTVSGVISAYGDSVRKKLKPVFDKVNVPYPPSEMTWIGLKEEGLLVLFAKDRSGKMRRVLDYPIFGASGVDGPKLKEGDMQVPEGIYHISRFRPVVIAHIGLELNYPNSDDQMHARREGRKNLGGDIMIHGSYWSTGCLAMGNEPIEELFVLAYDTKLANIQVVLVPCNLLVKRPSVDMSKQPKWLPELYSRLRTILQEYPAITKAR